MALLIALLLILVASTAVISFGIYGIRRSNMLMHEHEVNLNSPYRIIVDGNSEYRIQHYEWRKLPDEEPFGKWSWQNTTELFTDLEEAKSRYCELMAVFRYHREKDQPKFKENGQFSVKGNYIRTVIDMSSSIDKIDEILKKMREQQPKKRATRRKKND